MKEFVKRNYLKIMILFLVILVFLSGFYAFKLKEKYNLMLDNNYNDSFTSLVNYINSVENYLAKSMITESPEHAAETLTKVWSDSNLAMVYLSRLPVSSESVMNVSKFLNQVSDYTYSLSRKNIKGEGLEEKDFEKLKELYHHSKGLEDTLNTLSEELYNENLNWKEIVNKDESLAQAVDSFEVFSSIDKNLNDYEGLIYDGAYSDHINKLDKTGLIGEEIDEETAKNKVKEFFENYDIKEIVLNAFLDKADIPGYDFSVKLRDEDINLNIFISKKGGHVVQMSFDREVNEEKISNAEAIDIGKRFLDDKKYFNMKETYFIKESNVITINYAYNDSGITVYPDLIKVKIALDNGEVLGLETTGYLNSHKQRLNLEKGISIDKAREHLNKDLNVLSEGMAIIPTEWKAEILCYEFKGKVEDKDFLVYINAVSGKEEDVLVILDTPNGTLTM